MLALKFVWDYKSPKIVRIIFKRTNLEDLHKLDREQRNG